MNYLMGHAERMAGFFSQFLIDSLLIDYFFFALRVFWTAINKPQTAHHSDARADSVALDRKFYPALDAPVPTKYPGKQWYRCVLPTCI